MRREVVRLIKLPDLREYGTAVTQEREKALKDAMADFNARLEAANCPVRVKAMYFDCEAQMGLSLEWSASE